jgi:hypothetical protein
MPSAFAPSSRALQRLEPNRARENGLLLEVAFELTAERAPPFAIERLDLHFDHHDIVAVDIAVRSFPQAGRRRSLVGGHAAEPFRQRRPDQREQWSPIGCLSLSRVGSSS